MQGSTPYLPPTARANPSIVAVDVLLYGIVISHSLDVG